MFTQPGIVIHILYSTEKPSKQENKHLNMNMQTEMQNLLLKGILLTTCIKNIAKTDDLAKLMAQSENKILYGETTCLQDMANESLTA